MSIKEPLAARLRPQKLDDIVGQHHLLDPGRPLQTLIEQHRPLSFIFYGPPGIGKTTLASVIAKEYQLPIENFNAAIDNKAKLQKAVKAHPDESFALILDEIHRLTRPIQDFLLPYLESGHIVLLGATTANPVITIDPAIRSRCAMFELKPVNYDDISIALKRAWQTFHEDHQPDDQVFTKIAKASNGDVRTALNILETMHSMHGDQLDEYQVSEYIKENQFIFDKHGDNHYNTISALQKSIRGADTDAALYYTGVMCKSGDLETLIRRLKVITYEDIGLADPVRAQQAATALLTANDLGLPEARIPIANAVILLCTANHSNSAYVALDTAMQDAQNAEQHPVPYHLRDTHFSGAQKLGHQGYIYPHDYPHDWIAQQYLPKDLVGKQYYHAHENSSEEQINKRYLGLRQAQAKGIKNKQLD